jgi:hypothetical protein
MKRSGAAEDSYICCNPTNVNSHMKQFQLLSGISVGIANFPFLPTKNNGRQAGGHQHSQGNFFLFNDDTTDRLPYMAAFVAIYFLRSMLNKSSLASEGAIDRQPLKAIVNNSVIL